MADLVVTPQHIARLLAWYAEIGATGIVADTPVDWRAREGAHPGAGYRWPEAATPAAVGGTGASASVARNGGSAPRSTSPGPTSPRPTSAPAPNPPSTSLQATSPRPPPAQARPNTPPPAANGQEPRVRTFDAPASVRTGGGSTRVAARSLAELASELAAFDGCGLKATAKSLCLFRGAERSRLMVIGEAPGKEEDHAGKPFVGPAGQLLDRMLAAIGLSEADVHITNIVYWRPPGNRTPTPVEAAACAPFLTRQIELVAPSILLLMGGPATKHLLGIDEGILKVRGRWRSIQRGGLELAAMPTLHPAYLLRTPAAKRQAWRDLLAVKSRLAG